MSKIAGIVIINRETGETNYFDFGRYDERGKELGRNRKEDEGIVRSKKTVKALRTPAWDDTKSDIENVRTIMNELNKNVFKKYGLMYGALATDLEYEPMLKQAQELEENGYMPFGGYHTSSCDNTTYCAKFARCVGNAGGIDFGVKISIEDFSGVGNVLSVYKYYKSPIVKVGKSIRTSK